MSEFPVWLAVLGVGLALFAVAAVLCRRLVSWWGRAPAWLRTPVGLLFGWAVVVFIAIFPPKYADTPRVPWHIATGAVAFVALALMVVATYRAVRR